MSQDDPAIARQAIFEIIENQIDANDPPETAQTLERLKEEGHSNEEAMKLIGSVLASEMFAVMKENREYDHEKYVEALQVLPKLPWE